tara:strand:+ start:93 stop:722 length:630 start_codon:yes stop_codon:yes gene_type:complete
MKKGVKTAFYVGIVAIVGYLGWTLYKSTKEEDEEFESVNVGQTEGFVNEDGLLTEAPSDATPIDEGGVAEPQLDEPVLFGTEASGLQVLVENVANGVYEFTPVYNENGTLGLNDTLFYEAHYSIDGEYIGGYNSDSSVVQEFTNSGTYDFMVSFYFSDSVQYPDGAAFQLNGALNVVLDGGVPNPNAFTNYININKVDAILDTPTIGKE